MLTINGWTILAHPLFLDQLEKLTKAVETLKTKKPNEYQKTANAKLLAALNKLVFEKIPADPSATIYRQGSTFGEGYKHWFRAKFGTGRFRLFFRLSWIALTAKLQDDSLVRSEQPEASLREQQSQSTPQPRLANFP